MNQKISITGTKARQLFGYGANYVAEAVKSTIGPYGLNASIEKGDVITNDGFKISKELCLSLENEFARRGAITFHKIAAKTNDEVGDATSTSEALGQAIIKEASRLLPSENIFIAKKTGAEIIKTLAKERAFVEEELQKDIKQIETEEELINSALVSVEDETLAKLIGSAQWKIGKDGMIVAEETADTKSSIEYVKGIRIDNGFGTSAMMNNIEKQTLEVGEAATLLTSYVVDGLIQLKPMIDQILATGRRDIVIIAKAWSSNAIQECMKNHESNVRIYPMNCPFTNMDEIMRDLEAVLGGRYIAVEENRLEDMLISDIGTCNKVVSKRYNAIITGVADIAAKERVAKRIARLQEELTGEVSDFAKKALQGRISQLENGSAILKVGAETEPERKRLKDKCDDAVNAVRLAFQGGTVKGGGLAFKEIADRMDETYMLKRPLQVVYNQIMSTAPLEFKIEDWVRDPYLVLKSALKNACEIGGTFSTTNIVITARDSQSCSCNVKNNEGQE